jgi:hypothetical protein
MSDLPCRYSISISHIDIGLYLVTLLSGDVDNPIEISRRTAADFATSSGDVVGRCMLNR